LPGPDALVIRVEAIFEDLVEERVALQELAENEGLEEPRRMAEMPFGGARVVIRLDDLILIAQGRSKRAGEVPRGKKPLFEGG
jgi:hypothetical protein